METILVIALVAWAALGVNLLFTHHWDRTSSSDVRH